MGGSSVTGTGHGSAKTRNVYISELLPPNSNIITSRSGVDRFKGVTGGEAGQVKIDTSDTFDYLGNKLVAGSNINLVTSAGPNKYITISASGVPVVVNIGAVGSTFNPSISSVTSVIKGTVGANFIMSNINVTDGVTDKMLFRAEFTQTGIGGSISSWSSNFVGSDLMPLSSIGLSVGVGKTDILVFEYDSDRAKYMLVGFINGVNP